MDIGKAIRELRESRDLTREQLADAVGVSYWALAKYETGERTPNPALLTQIASVLGVTVDRLLGLPASPESIDPEIAVIMRSLKGRTEEQRQSILAFIRYLDEQEAKRTHERGDRSPELPAQPGPVARDPRSRGPKTGA